jgi:LacI family transcriptional regulator
VVATYGQTAATTRAVADHGLQIAENVRIVAFDGGQTKYGQFDTTSAQQPVDTIAQHALERLMATTAASSDSRRTRPELWEPYLHVGNTCGC